MKYSTISGSEKEKAAMIPNSNSVFLNVKEWAVTLVLFFGICFGIYFGWYRWEKFLPEPDFRSTCWEERMSDYWAYARWTRYAREHYTIFLMGDSVIWGQEVNNDETISHFLNAESGKEIVANLGVDGLHCAGENGMIKWFGQYIHDSNIILEFNPLWMSEPLYDLRGNWKNFFHPRLAPQFSTRIHYFRSMNERLGYLFENCFRIPALVRHIMVDYFGNKSVTAWIMANPYRNPFSAITFQAAPLMRKAPGRGLDWETKKLKMKDSPFVPFDESVQWKGFLGALDKLKKKNMHVFVLLGPFNTYQLTPKSSERYRKMIAEVKKTLDRRGYPWFDCTTGILPSNAFADDCHLLKGGHAILAGAMMKDTGFRKWIEEIR
ncbi:MAG: hypothetical protein WCU00_14275 [Candidatus Latescibacterota bacterium]